MTSGEKINKGMTLFAEGLAEVINNLAKEFVKVWDKVKPMLSFADKVKPMLSFADKVKPMLSFADKKITKKKFKKLLQSCGIQRNEINKIVANNKEPYTYGRFIKTVNLYKKESE